MSTLKAPQHSYDARIYIAAFCWLVVLTLIELAAVFLKLPHQALLILILATAFGKALLIAFFFMHLKFEHKIVWLLPGIPVLFAIFFLLMIYPDIARHLTHLF